MAQIAFAKVAVEHLIIPSVNRVLMTAVAAGLAWARAEDEGRVQKQGSPEQKPQSAVIAKPTEHFALAHGVGEKYVEMALALCPPR